MLSIHNAPVAGCPLQLPINSSNVEYMGSMQGFIARHTEQKLPAYQLRHQVYCQELKWQPPHISGLEIDAYDKHSDLVCVTDDLGLNVATIRITDSDTDWLVDEFFKQTLTRPTSLLKRRGCVEASRLAIDEHWRNRKITDDGATVLDLLLITLINHTSFLLKKRSVLITTTPLMGVTLKRRGVAIEQLGSIITMEDNCKIATFICDLEVTRDQYRIYRNYMSNVTWNATKL